MCPLLAQLIIGFFSFFAAAVYSTNEANKAGLKQSIFLDVYGYHCQLASSYSFKSMVASHFFVTVLLRSGKKHPAPPPPPPPPGVVMAKVDSRSSLQLKSVKGIE
jgi:hypothetical protein